MTPDHDMHGLFPAVEPTSARRWGAIAIALLIAAAAFCWAVSFGVFEHGY